MTKEMIVSATDRETAVAILEDDQVVEFFMERERQQGVVGNVYKGRVSKVLPGMQSSFIDLGLERDGFLYVSDVITPAEALEDDPDEPSTPADDVAAGLASDVDGGGLDVADGRARQSDAPDDGAGDDEASQGANGHTPPAQAAGRNGDRRQRQERAAQPNIEDLLKEGQDVLVQVVKEPIGTKGARITSHVTIPGRFLVFMPTVDHIGVSRKIESREERARLRGIVRQFRELHAFNGGVIIRTAAANRPDADILGDLDYFLQVWKEIKHKSETQRSPAVIYREQSLVAKLLRDLLTDEFSVIRIDSPEEFRRVTSLVERIMPAMLPRVKLYTRDFPIFEEYGVRTEIDKALRSKVWLKSGGYIVINQTEALVAIDVNTGRYVGKKTTGRLEDTILKTNLEAVKEIVRQLRLRDMGGIVVLDFIDMEDKKNRQKVFQTLEGELRRDRAPSKAIQVSDFGLIIITRKRVKQSLERLMTDQCPYCSGTGTIKSSATVCQEILNEFRKVGNDLDGHGVLLRVNPEIAEALQGDERGVLREVEQVVGRKVTVRPDAYLHHEQFDVMSL
ncbi:Rne/Rng family ribonuclease [Luteitalea sp.]|uniref:Rne/Rng family ribonuclease n=1 Tax=Luteitalea sp. TaxID=2004800 RepID=UPI000AC06EF4|nr:Rne/Rng family ribonuclease [Luteitalea sp.]